MARLRAPSRSNSSESMRCLDDLRVDSYQQAPAWQQQQGGGSYTKRRGGTTLDDIDYMSEEEEGASLRDASGSDTTHGARPGGRCASPHCTVINCSV